MPQTIEVPGVGRFQFPDGMSDAEISKALETATAPKQTVADETGRLETFGIAAGKKTDSILDGLTQLYLRATGDDKALGGLKTNVEEKERLYAPLKQKHPIITGMGEAVPSLAGGPGGGLLRAFVTGAAPEALSYGSAEDRAKNALIGGAGNMVGSAIGTGVGRLLRPAGHGTAGLSDDALAAAQRVGVKLTPGQVSQNPAMQGFENYLARSPGSSGAMQAKAASNTAAVNRAAASAMGQSSNELSEGVFSTAKNAIGSEFERLQSVTAPKLGNDFLNAVAKVDADNGARGAFKNAEIDRLIDKSLDLAVKGNLSGKAYKEIRSELSSEATKAFKNGDATLGQAYKQIRKALDDSAEQSLSAADKKAWATTREQWKAYKTLTQGAVSEGGNVSPARLAGALRKEGDGLRTGAAKGPLSDVARLGEALKGVPNPTSGQLTQQMLYGNPLTGLPMIAGNKVAGALYNAPAMQSYLSNGLLNLGENGQLLLGAAARPAGAPVVRQYLGAE